jgi:hypothetical protein
LPFELGFLPLLKEKEKGREKGVGEEIGKRLLLLWFVIAGNDLAWTGYLRPIYFPSFIH